MNKFELTDKQLNNLFLFLNRSNLQGSEALIFMELVQIFQNPIQNPIKEEEKEGEKIEDKEDN